MAFERKTKEQWDAEAKEKSLAKTADNVNEIMEALNAAKATGTKENALLVLAVNELMKINDNLKWINIALKKKVQSDNIPF